MVTRTDVPTLYSLDARKTKVDVKEMGLRGYTRKIGMLERYDGKLQCGQCHVEYNCNPGFNPNTGEAITMADQRTNYFPFVDVNNVLKAYDGIQFRDFRNQFTGAALWKAQHPDVETYYNSKHEKLGIDCTTCHMPKIKDAKTGKFYTSHWQTNPKNYLKETCLRCHSQWDETQARYVIESMAAHYQGKVRNAEFWLSQLIGKFGQAQLVGVGEDALKAARAKHGDAHANWEWWTAANGASFHNPELAHESLAKSVSASQEGHQDPRRRDQGAADGHDPDRGCSDDCAGTQVTWRRATPIRNGARVAIGRRLRSALRTWKRLPHRRDLLGHRCRDDGRCAGVRVAAPCAEASSVESEVGHGFERGRVSQPPCRARPRVRLRTVERRPASQRASGYRAPTA